MTRETRHGIQSQGPGPRAYDAQHLGIDLNILFYLLSDDLYPREHMEVEFLSSAGLAKCVDFSVSTKVLGNTGVWGKWDPKKPEMG